MSTVAIAGSAFTFGVCLYSQADTKLLQTPPTIAAGDFKRSINGGAWTNCDNLPTVNPAGGAQIEVVLAAAETTAAGAGGRIAVKWEDALGAEWCSGYALIFVHAAESVAQTGDAYGRLTGTVEPLVAAQAIRDALKLDASGGAPAAGSVDTHLDDILADTTEIGAAGAGLTAIPKTGYKLASDGLDQISAAEPTGRPTTFAGWIMWLIQKARRSNLTSTELTTMTEAGATITTQAVSDDGTVQSLGAPS